jgi:hypothetical protein
MGNPKFYVLCGEVRQVLCRPSAIEAAVDGILIAFLANPAVQLHIDFVKVSEWGFPFESPYSDDDIIFPTDGILKLVKEKLGTVDLG